VTAPDPKRTTRQYSRIVGVAFLIFIIFIGIRIINSKQEGGLGLAHGTPVPKFSAPSATGTLDGDANIFQDAEQAGKDNVPACQVDEPDAIRICDFFDKPLVMVVWFTKCGNCERQLDTVERVRKRFPKVRFLGVEVAGSRDEARKLVTERGWGFPMALDRDGAVSAMYNVEVGPTTFFIYPKGVVEHTAIGELNERVLATGVENLARGPRRPSGSQ